MAIIIPKSGAMKPWILLFILVGTSALLLSWVAQAMTTKTELTIPSYTNVDPQEAHEMINQQEVVILDVRTQEEYNSGYIPDTLLIPLSELESRLDELNPSAHILVYCRSGVRSAEAASLLVANDFTHVYNMQGGILEWQAEGFPVYTEPTQTTSPEPTMPSCTDVTPKRAYAMISQQEIVVLDVRTKEEYDSVHISEALLIPISELESRLDELNSDDHILVYGESGYHSKQAAQILLDNGFIHVYSLEGGIAQWRAQGLPLGQASKSP